ncbi:phospholipase A [Halarcobacter ebronensis]|uniref:phospholipase A n=1 Tax=Halarcobacter ebronensis TaxID=1462615 RepID=UPI0019D6ED93|nr:phospholipase A [Halarcobacter ebronensis]
MKFIKKLIILSIFSSLLSAQTLDELYEKASKLESQNRYKEAMEIYKEIALKQKENSRIYYDENKEVAQEVANNTLDKIEDKETRSTIEQILASSFDLYPYEENYLLPFSYDNKKKSDRKSTEVKFQISVKKPILTNFFKMNETINFGYTQTSWWQLYDDSAPFRETNYRPEVFVEVPYGKRDETSLKGFKFGFLHESNGLAGADSRSWNRIYLTSYFQMGNLFIAPRVWYKLPEHEDEDDNPDIQKYLGYGDITLLFPYKDQTFKLLLRNNLRTNGDNKGFTQFDWTFPFFGSKTTFGYVQLSNGYGDSLIDYNKEINRFSFGISLSR